MDGSIRSGGDLIVRAAKLTPRQRQCLRLAYQRRTSKEIAAELGLGVGTVDTYVSEAVSTLGARNRRQAAEWLVAIEGEPAVTLADAAPRRPQLELTGGESHVGHPEESAEGSTGDWRRLLPLRPKGAAHNDLGIGLRLFWIPALAVAFSVGLGMLGFALVTLSQFFRWLAR